MLHNSYRLAGGEERAVLEDRALLESRGHETRLYQRSSDEIPQGSLTGKVALAAGVAWSAQSYRRVRALVRSWQPDVAHFHNIFPLISPSAYAACRAEGVPVVQTLHNYRLVCAPGTLLREGRVCELCVGRVPWPAIKYACYRGSRAESAVLVSAISAHSFAGTWRRDVDAYIALTEFGRRIFIRGGLPDERLFVRPNALRTPGPVPYGGARSAVFVGRLSPEKGIRVLLDAWSRIPEIPLSVIGTGPLLEEVRTRVAGADLHHVEVTGELPHDQVFSRLRTAGMLIFPSLWYEGFGYSLLEALSTGVPVIASDLGAQAEVVRDGINGLLFPPGDADALVRAVRRLAGSRQLADHVARGAHEIYATHYSAAESYARLMEVYDQVGAFRVG
ncbi:MAG: glycosyltransferase family 4 protein [Chloroflexota bacterium]|nr:glycosyltransferase family 4 protein [Chloroflexota bacterium]